MSNRNEFMLMARLNRLEFSSLRRASYSTLCLLREITNDMDGFHLFTHSSQCRTEDCNLALCKMLKAAIEHAFRCLNRYIGKCAVCKKLISLYSCHSRFCSERNCTVPHCSRIKEYLNKRKLNGRYILVACAILLKL